MELRIDPGFPSAFERLKKGFRKQSVQVREALAEAARNGHGLPQQDKLTLAWKQHKRAVFWVRVDRAIRLMYEQDGNVQTVLFVGKHQEAEAFLRDLPKKCPAEDAIGVTDWLQRTAAPAIAARLDNLDKPENDRKPAATLGAHRQLIQAMENLVEECLLNVGPAVVEEYAAPHVIEVERRLANLRERIGDDAKAMRQAREQLEGRLEELAERVARLDKSLHGLRTDMGALRDEGDARQSAWVEAASELRRETLGSCEATRRELADELASTREAWGREEDRRSAQLQTLEQRLEELRRAVGKVQAELPGQLDQVREECRRYLDGRLEQQQRDEEERERQTAALLAAAQAHAFAQAAELERHALRHNELSQQVADLEARLAQHEADRGLVAAWRRLWRRS